MYQYEVIIYYSYEDAAYIAEMPELPGCMADGGTQDEAQKNIEAIAKEWNATAREQRREIPHQGKLQYT